MPRVVGVDCSTQATKVVVCDAESGAVLEEARAAHPAGTAVHPRAWWEALMAASGGAEGLLSHGDAVAVGGQQHGMVLVDADGEVTRDALLWNDTRSAPEAGDLVRELGGPQAWADAVGSVPVAAFTVTKLRWTARHDAAAANRTRAVMLPHDWVSWQLLGGAASGASPATDRGDASGTGYFAARDDAYRHDLVELAFGRDLELPRVLGPHEAAGETPWGAVVAAGTGDNMAAALGLGAGPGDVVVSLGTSGTVFAMHDAATADPSGTVAGFADATGGFLPLVCTLNAARVLDAVASMLGVDHETLSELALTAPPGAGGLTLLPYLDGERTPDLPGASGSLLGLTRANLTPACLARAAVEGMLCGLADGMTALQEYGVVVRRVLLVGGAARSRAVQECAAALLEVPVVVPAPGEYVAVGAARQAAWALSEATAPPQWPVANLAEVSPGDVAGSREARARYAAARQTVHGR